MKWKSFSIKDFPDKLLFCQFFICCFCVCWFCFHYFIQNVFLHSTYLHWENYFSIFAIYYLVFFCYLFFFSFVDMINVLNRFVCYATIWFSMFQWMVLVTTINVRFSECKIREKLNKTLWQIDKSYAIWMDLNRTNRISFVYIKLLGLQHLLVRQQIIIYLVFNTP